MGSLPKVDDTGAIESLRKITQPLVSDIRIDSAVAIETSGDLRLVVTQVTDNCDMGCCVCRPT